MSELLHPKTLSILQEHLNKLKSIYQEYLKEIREIQHSAKQLSNELESAAELIRKRQLRMECLFLKLQLYYKSCGYIDL